jgi:hypothetical protein
MATLYAFGVARISLFGSIAQRTLADVVEAKRKQGLKGVKVLLTNVEGTAWLFHNKGKSYGFKGMSYTYSIVLLS